MTIKPSLLASFITLAVTLLGLPGFSHAQQLEITNRTESVIGMASYDSGDDINETDAITIDNGTLELESNSTLTVKGDISLTGANSRIIIHSGASLLFDPGLNEVFRVLMNTSGQRIEFRGVKDSRGRIGKAKDLNGVKAPGDYYFDSSPRDISFSGFYGRIEDANNPDGDPNLNTDYAWLMTLKNDDSSVIRADHIEFDGCGRIQINGSDAGDETVVNLSYLTFKNSLTSPTFGVDGFTEDHVATTPTTPPEVKSVSPTTTSDNRSITHIVADKPISLRYLTGYTLHNFVIDAAGGAGDRQNTSAGMAKIHNNVFVASGRGGSATGIIADDNDGVYFYMTGDNPHGMTTRPLVGDTTVSSYWFEMDADDLSDTGDAFVTTGSVGPAPSGPEFPPDIPYRITIKDCGVLGNSDPSGGGATLISFTGNGVDDPDEAFRRLEREFVVEHCLAKVNPDSQALAFDETGNTLPGTGISVTNSVFYADTDPNTDNTYSFAIGSAVSASEEVAALNPFLEVDSNLYGNLAGGGSNFAHKAVFDIDVDESSINANPVFVDGTRNLKSWDALLTSGTGSARNAIEQLKKRNDDSGFDTRYTVERLIRYMREGYTLDVNSGSGLAGAVDDEGRPWGPSLDVSGTESEAVEWDSTPASVSNNVTFTPGTGGFSAGSDLAGGPMFYEAFVSEGFSTDRPYVLEVLAPNPATCGLEAVAQGSATMENCSVSVGVNVGPDRPINNVDIDFHFSFGKTSVEYKALGGGRTNGYLAEGVSYEQGDLFRIEVITADGMTTSTFYKDDTALPNGENVTTPAAAVGAALYAAAYINGRGAIDSVTTSDTGGNDPGIAPELALIGPQSATEGSNIVFDVAVIDENVGATLSAQNLPSGASFSPATGTFSWPNAGPTGAYDVTFIATANGQTDSESVTITVTPAGGGAGPETSVSWDSSPASVANNVTFTPGGGFSAGSDLAGAPMFYEAFVSEGFSTDRPYVLEVLAPNPATCGLEAASQGSATMENCSVSVGVNIGSDIPINSADIDFHFSFGKTSVEYKALGGGRTNGYLTEGVSYAEGEKFRIEVFTVDNVTTATFYKDGTALPNGENVTTPGAAVGAALYAAAYINGRGAINSITTTTGSTPVGPELDVVEWNSSPASVANNVAFTPGTGGFSAGSDLAGGPMFYEAFVSEGFSTDRPYVLEVLAPNPATCGLDPAQPATTAGCSVSVGVNVGPDRPINNVDIDFHFSFGKTSVEYKALGGGRTNGYLTEGVPYISGDKFRIEVFTVDGVTTATFYKDGTALPSGENVTTPGAAVGAALYAAAYINGRGAINSVATTSGDAGGSDPGIAPELVLIGPQSAAEGSNIVFDVAVIDENVGATLSAQNLPSGASFSPATGTFNWPNAGPTGAYDVTFVATANGQTDSESVTITVTPASSGAGPEAVEWDSTPASVANNVTFTPGTGGFSAGSDLAGVEEIYQAIVSSAGNTDRPYVLEVVAPNPATCGLDPAQPATTAGCSVSVGVNIGSDIPVNNGDIDFHFSFGKTSVEYKALGGGRTNGYLAEGVSYEQGDLFRIEVFTADGMTTSTFYKDDTALPNGENVTTPEAAVGAALYAAAYINGRGAIDSVTTTTGVGNDVSVYQPYLRGYPLLGWDVGQIGTENDFWNRSVRGLTPASNSDNVINYLAMAEDCFGGNPGAEGGPDDGKEDFELCRSDLDFRGNPLAFEENGEVQPDELKSEINWRIELGVSGAPAEVNNNEPQAYSTYVNNVPFSLADSTFSEYAIRTNDTFGVACDFVRMPTRPVDDSGNEVPIRIQGNKNNQCGPNPAPGEPYNGQEEGDCHYYAVDTVNGFLYEQWRSYNIGNTPGVGPGDYAAGCSVRWDMKVTQRGDMRGLSCTSANAAGTPYVPFLITPGEIKAGVIKHALGITLYNDFIRPFKYVLWDGMSSIGGGTHNPPTTNTSNYTTASPEWMPKPDTENGEFLPDGQVPHEQIVYGSRVRLRDDFEIGENWPQGVRVILEALKEYGAFILDGTERATWIAASSDFFDAASWDDEDIGLGSFSLEDVAGLEWSHFELVSKYGEELNPDQIPVYPFATDDSNLGAMPGDPNGVDCVRNTSNPFEEFQPTLFVD